jgi:branched-chain amino acid transport system permease protein
MIQIMFNGVVSGLLVALPALSLALTFSTLRFANFAIGAMMTFGAYLVYWFNTGLDLGMPAAAALGCTGSALLAVATDRLVFTPLKERAGIVLLIASMGVAFVLENAVRFFAGNDPVGYRTATARPIRIAGVLRINHEQIVIAAVSLAALLVIGSIFYYSPLGRAMRGLADNPDLAAVRGISRRRVAGVIWLLSGALAALSGMFVGLDATLDPQMGWNYILLVFSAAILGGINNPMGAIPGALLMGVFSEMSTLVIAPHYRTLSAFLLLSLLLIIRPSGLLSRQRIDK